MSVTELVPNLKGLYNAIWSVIHVSALTNNNSESAKREFTKMMYAFQVLLPDRCSRMTLRIYMEMNDINKAFPLTKDKNSYNRHLFKWTYDLHAFANHIRTIENRMEYSRGRLHDNPTMEQNSTLDYESAFSLHSNINSTKDWGPNYWKTIHGLAVHLDNKLKREAFKTFLLSLRFTLPCSTCAKHLTEKLSMSEFSEAAMDAAFESIEPRLNGFKYTVNLHNNVNNDVGHPSVSINEAIKIHDYYRYDYSAVLNKKVCAADKYSKNKRFVK